MNSGEVCGLRATSSIPAECRIISCQKILHTLKPSFATDGPSQRLGRMSGATEHQYRRGREMKTGARMAITAKLDSQGYTMFQRSVIASFPDFVEITCRCRSGCENSVLVRLAGGRQAVYHPDLVRRNRFIEIKKGTG